MDNTTTGFYYEVTPEQIREHKQRTVSQIFQWLHDTNIFLKSVQTSEEKERMNNFKKS